MKSGKIINLVKEEYRINRTRAAEIADAKLSAAMKNEDFAKITREISALNFEIAFAKAHNNDTSAKEKELRLAFEKRVALLKKMKMSEKDFERQILSMFQNALLRSACRLSRYRTNAALRFRRRRFF